MDSDQDLYQILQIDPAAEQEVVQAAFKRLALKYHPDKNPSPDANRRMQELNDAYDVISDPVQRAAYDRERQEKLTAQRQAEEEARYRAEAQRRTEASQLRREQKRHDGRPRMNGGKKHGRLPRSVELNTNSKFAPNRPPSGMRSVNGNSANGKPNRPPRRQQRQLKRRSKNLPRCLKRRSRLKSSKVRSPCRAPARANAGKSP